MEHHSFDTYLYNFLTKSLVVDIASSELLRCVFIGLYWFEVGGSEVRLEKSCWLGEFQDGLEIKIRPVVVVVVVRTKSQATPEIRQSYGK